MGQRTIKDFHFYGVLTSIKKVISFNYLNIYTKLIQFIKSIQIYDITYKLLNVTFIGDKSILMLKESINIVLYLINNVKM